MSDFQYRLLELLFLLLCWINAKTIRYRSSYHLAFPFEYNYVLYIIQALSSKSHGWFIFCMSHHLFLIGGTCTSIINILNKLCPQNPYPLWKGEHARVDYILIFKCIYSPNCYLLILSSLMYLPFLGPHRSWIILFSFSTRINTSQVNVIYSFLVCSVKPSYFPFLFHFLFFSA